MVVLTQYLQKIPPLVWLALGLFSALMSLIFLPLKPSLTWGTIALITGIIALLYQRFFIAGITLGIIAIAINAAQPYQQKFTHCHYQADISQANYARSYRGQEIRLQASNIHCAGQKLPNQTLQFWDNKKQFSGLENHRMTVNSHLYPIHASLNPNQFDYEKALIANGIRLQVKKPKILKKHPQYHPILQLRHAFSTAINNHLSPQNAAIILALITGNRTALSPSQKQTLQQTGSSHILAISGLHLALVGGLAWLVGQWLWALSWRLSDKIMPIQAGAVFAFIVISIYALLTGFDVPVKRAWVMFSLLIFSWLCLKSLSTQSLLIAAIAVMFTTPYSVVSVGFYFSFIATFIVLWCSQLNYPPFIRILIMQGLINLALLPITWFAFSMISLSAFLVNLLIIPFLGFWVLPWAILACLISLIFPDFSIPVWAILDFTTSALWQTIDFFKQLNWAITPSFSPTLLIVVIAVSSLLLALITHIKWIAFGILLVFLPIKYSTTPAFILADDRYTSALIHNGEMAIIINPGRYYRQTNKAQKWQHYLQRHHLSLAAIILSDEKISHISATKWLLNRHSNAKVITLKPISLPYSNDYCQPLKLKQLALITKKQKKYCYARLSWFGQSIDLFNSKSKQALIKKSRMIWQEKNYQTQQLGAITIILNSNSHSKKPLFTLTSERQKQRLWRQ